MNGGMMAELTADGLAVKLPPKRRNLYDGILLHEFALAQTMAARALVEQEPNYAFVSARLLLNNLRDEALAFVLPSILIGSQRHVDLRYDEYFPEYIHLAIKLHILDKELAAFDLPRLAAALRPERDRNFQFLGLQTLYDRYFLHRGGVRFELPQAFFMRVAMGLAAREIDRDARAIAGGHQHRPPRPRSHGSLPHLRGSQRRSPQIPGHDLCKARLSQAASQSFTTK